MKNRRSFLKLLGIGVVAAPALAKAAQVAAEASPAVEISWSVDGGATYSPVQARDLIEAQRAINRRRSAMLRLLNDSNNYRPIA